MASLLGLLEVREKKVLEEVARLREEAERVQAALGEAERALQRLADARVTVAEVLAEPPCAVVEPVVSAMAGAVVPRRAEGMTSSVLPADYHSGGHDGDRHRAPNHRPELTLPPCQSG